MPAGCPLVAEEVRASDEPHVLAPNCRFGPIGPGIGKCQSGHRHEYVDPDGWHADLIEELFVSEIIGRKTSKRCSESGEGAKHFQGIFLAGFYPEVQVLGVARLRV